MHTFVDNEYSGFLDDAKAAVAAGLQDPVGVRHPSRQEPDLVAGLLLDGAPELARRWKARLLPHGFGLRITAVYAHQSPIVRHQHASRAPELGDLLIASFHTDRHGYQERRALLLQAKIGAQTSFNVAASDYHQLVLYEHWPDFTYVRPRELAGIQRTVLPSRAHAGAEYLLLQTPGRHGSSYRAWTGKPGARVDATRALENALAEMLAVRHGRAFFPAPCSCADHGWSQTVWDLITAARTRAFNRRASGRINAPRAFDPPEIRSGSPFFLTSGFPSDRSSSVLDTYAAATDGVLLFREDAETFDEDPGASVLIIETVETEADAEAEEIDGDSNEAF